MAGLGPAHPGQRGRRGEHLQAARRRVHGGVDRQRGLVHPAQLFGAGVDVNQLLFRHRRFDQRVAAGGGLAQARADGDQQVAFAHTPGQRGVDAQAHVARVERVVVVKGVLKAEGVGHRQLPVFGKSLQRGGGLRCPPSTTGDHQRALADQQQGAQFAQRARVAPGLHGLHARQGLGVHGLREHVFGQHQHHRARPAVHGGGKRARHVLRDAARIVDALHAFGHALGGGAEERQVVNFLKSLAVARVARHVADEQHHGRAVLKRGVQADRRVGGAGPARHKAHAGAPGELALGFGHEGRAAFLAVGDKADAVGVGVKAVQHGEVTFTRNTEGVSHALLDQALHKKVTGDLGHSIDFIN